MIWYAAYELIMNFRQEKTDSGNTGLLKVENAPIMHIEGYSLSQGDEEKLETWFSKWGSELYIPLLSLGTQKRPLAGGSNAASGRWLNDSSFGLSRQGFLYLLAA
jgi:hypothetical protein